MSLYDFPSTLTMRLPDELSHQASDPSSLSSIDEDACHGLSFSHRG
jgi:hypothetical protein